MDRLPVFISHSSHGPGPRAWLTAFAGALRVGPDAVEPRFDLELITTGQQWREVINGMLWEGPAGVVLVSPDALASPWVLKEATILRARFDRREEFLLVPVLCGVTLEELQASRLWGPLDLPAVQFPRSSDPAEVAAEVKAQLAPLASMLDRSPLARLAGQVASELRESAEAQCQDVLNKIGEALPLRMVDETDGYARAITAWVLRQPPPALNRIADALAELGKSFPADRVRAILELVAPLWVDPEAASRLVEAHSRPDGPRSVALACAKPKVTVRHYLDSAYLPSRAPTHVRLHGITGGSHADDVADELRSALRRQVQDLSDESDEEIDEYLNGLRRPFYVSVGLPEDSEVMADLRGRYAKITFIYHAAALRDPAELPWVLPQLEAGEESAAFSDYVEAVQRFNSDLPRSR
jgi:hypothetical protein